MLFVDDKGGDIYELINTAMIRNTMNDAINTAMIMPSLHHQEKYEHVLKFALCPELISYHVKQMQNLLEYFKCVHHVISFTALYDNVQTT